MYMKPGLKMHVAVADADALAQKARDLCEAAKNIYEYHLFHGYMLTRSGKKIPINGDITKVRWAHGLTQTQKFLLNNLSHVSRMLSGTQELRLQMGHALAGAGIQFGAGVFITISPSMRHSGLRLRLFRKRQNDPYMKYGDPEPVSYTHLTLPTILRV